jgi:hypothetical protein
VLGVAQQSRLGLSMLLQRSLLCCIMTGTLLQLDCNEAPAGVQQLAHVPLVSACLQGCASDRLIDTAVLGGPKVFVVATLASERPAAPFAFRSYELPEEAGPAAAALAACGGSCKHHVWEVSGRCCFVAALRCWYCLG